MKGLVALVGRFGRWFKGVFGFLARKKFLPKGFVALFVLVEFFSTLYLSGDVGLALRELAFDLFSADVRMNQLTNLALESPSLFGLWDLYGLVTSVFILYFFVKYLYLFFVRFTGSYASIPSFFVAFLLMFVLQYAMSFLVLGSYFGYIPVWDGLLFSVLNVDQVWGALFV